VILGGGVLIPSTVTSRTLETVNDGHVLLVLSETSIVYVSGLVVSFAGKFKVKLNVRLEPSVVVVVFTPFTKT